MARAASSRKSERGRQAEIEAARAREIEEERLALVERAEQAVKQQLELAESQSSKSLPAIRNYVGRGMTARVTREYVREVMLEPALRRLHDIGHGIAKFDTPIGDGVVLKLEAPAAVQRGALSDVIAIGVPKLRGGIDGDGSPIQGVIVLGTLEGLDDARQRAAAARMEDHGVVQGTGPPRVTGGQYVPPPGHEIVVYEEDLTGSKPRPSPDDAPPPTTSAVLTKAQEIAARRKAARQKR